MTDEPPRVLIVDDDPEILALTAGFLASHGMSADTATDGGAMDRRLAERAYDAIVLDLMLPGEDGLSLCRRLRARSGIPIVMLTAVGDDTDRIVGLELGADDYIAKPFNPRELVARLRAVLRRARLTASAPEAAAGGAEAGPRGQRRRFAGWELDLARRELRDPEGVLVTLTGGEWTLLVAFVDHPQRVLNRDQLLDLTRGRTAAPFDRAIDVQLSRLRRKIEPDPREPTLIRTVRGDGYMLAVPVIRL